MLQPEAARLTPAAVGENVFVEKSVDPVSTLFSGFIVSCNMAEEQERWEEALLQSSEDDVCKHVSAVMAGHIAPLGEFSSLAVAAWQTGGVAPFFFLLCPRRRQYHSSDLSPFGRLNV